MARLVFSQNGDLRHRFEFYAADELTPEDISAATPTVVLRHQVAVVAEKNLAVGSGLAWTAVHAFEMGVLQPAFAAWTKGVWIAELRLAWPDGRKEVVTPIEILAEPFGAPTTGAATKIVRSAEATRLVRVRSGPAGSVDFAVAGALEAIRDGVAAERDTLAKISDALDGEASERQAAIGAEATARTDAIAAEAEARQTADEAEATARTGAIAAEAVLRQAADNAEALARANADTAEAQARAAADLLKADKSRQILAGGLATGGGDLTGDRTITVAETSQADAEAGAGAAGAMTGRRTRQAIEALKGAASGLAPLGSDSKIPSQYLPAVGITDSWPVNSQAEMLALDAQTGDVAVRLDLKQSFILRFEPATVLANWLKLETPLDAVQSVNGQTGAVALGAADVGAQPVDQDLTDFAALAPANDYVLQRKAGAWTARSPSQLIADLMGKTVVADAPVFDVTQTWNNAAVAFTADRVNVNDNNSAAGSLLLDRQVGGVSKFKVDKTGLGTFQSAVAATQGWFTSGLLLGSLTGGDVALVRDGADILGLRRGLNPQALRVANSYTDNSNNELGALQWVSNTLQLRTIANGTGTARDILLVAASGGQLRLTNGSATSGMVQVLAGTANPNIHALSIGQTFSAASGSNAMALINPTINQSGTAGYDGVLVDITETATGSGGKYLFRGRVGGGDKVSVTNGGILTTASSILSGFHVHLRNNGASLNFGSSDDITVCRDAADVLALRRGLNPQTFRIYGTFTDSANGEWGEAGWVSNIWTIATKKLGTGGSRPISIQAGSGQTVRIGNSDNPTTLSVGAISATIMGRAQLIPPSDGVLTLTNAANTDFNRINLGGNTSAAPALKRSGADLQARLADDSGFAVIQGIHKAHANAVAETPPATHTITIQDATGTTYRLLAAA